MLAKSHKFYLVLFIITTFINLTFSERLSGLYINNGLNQTVAHNVVTFKVKERVKRELLNLLDIRKRPKPIEHKTDLVKRSAPMFLLNIYAHALTDVEKELQEKIFGEDIYFKLTDRDISAIQKSDVIMTFGAHNPHPGKKNNRGRRIWFNISEVPLGERMIAADLRLYRMMNRVDVNYDKDYIIEVYRIEGSRDNKRTKHFVDSTIINAWKNDWIILNVSAALQYWMTNPLKNRGFLLLVRSTLNSNRTMQPNDVGIVGLNGPPEKQPFMATYFESPNIRDTMDRFKREMIMKNDMLKSFDLPKKFYAKPKDRTKVCGLQTLYVNFKDLQWHDWIIAPDGYHANVCTGECNFPLHQNMNATNHAIVQVLISLMQPGHIPKPCCAPTLLSAISVLYFLDDSNVVLKKYKNMVADSCGCH